MSFYYYIERSFLDFFFLLLAIQGLGFDESCMQCFKPLLSHMHAFSHWIKGGIIIILNQSTKNKES